MPGMTGPQKEADAYTKRLAGGLVATAAAGMLRAGTVPARALAAHCRKPM
jgi:hypothetical protein